MSNETMKKSLKDRAREFTVMLPFMEGREKGESKDLIGQVSTITDYGFLPSEEKDGTKRDYVCFITAERSGKFYFGGTVLTDQMQQLEAEGYHDAVVAEGLPMLMTEKRSKNGRTYTNVEFYPEV